MRLVVLSLFALAFAGCGVSTSDEPDSASSSTCRQQPAEPISVNKTVEALRSNGYDMTSLASNTVCELERVVGYLTNAPTPEGLSKNENAQEKGHVICHVESRDNDTSRSFRSRSETGKVIMFAENVRCTVYPVGDREDEQVQALEAVLTDLVKVAG